MLEGFIHFFLGSAAILLLWFAYLVLNNALDALNPGFVQEVLGTAVSFGLFMSIGVVLYYASQELLLGWFVILVALLILFSVRKLWSRLGLGGSNNGNASSGAK